MKVEINHLTKVIQGNVVLDDINACFSCASGENGGRIYGIQGINGSGKTMLMRVICGLVLPTMGTVSIDGEIIGDRKSTRLNSSHIEESRMPSSA